MQKKYLIVGAIVGSAILVGGVMAASAHGPGRGGMQHENHGKTSHKGGKMNHQGHKHAAGPKGDASEATRAPAAATQQQHKH